MRQLRLVLLLVMVGLWPVMGLADPYYNSTETGCDGSDTNVAFCDDFEDGVWYATDADTSGGGTNATNDGWYGTIWSNPITPANAILCGGGVTPFGNCLANGGTKPGGPDPAQRNMALRHLKTSGCGTTGAQLCDVGTLYVRWYVKWVSGYSFGAEKHLNFTTSDGDIAFANIQLNCGSGGTASTATPYIQVIHGEDMCDPMNTSGITLSSGIWYFFEMRVTAHATNGTIQLWVNDCGAAGDSCGSSPTLRYSRTGLRLPGNVNGSQIQTIHLESWANPNSVGTGPYWDQMKAAQVGPIGFAGSSGGGSPATQRFSPSINLRVQ